jgi:hypothetical protein
MYTSYICQVMPKMIQIKYRTMLWLLNLIKNMIVSDSCEKSINELIHITQLGSYYALMRSDNDTELDFTKSTNKYKIHADELINKITLENCQNKGSYYLRGSGFNLASAQLIDEKLTFDIGKQNKSNKLSEIIKIAVGQNSLVHLFSYHI